MFVLLKNIEMKILGSFFLLFIIIIGCSCNASLGRTYADRDYQNELREMPPFLVAHFPKEIDRLPISSAITTDTTSQCIQVIFYLGAGKL